MSSSFIAIAPATESGADSVRNAAFFPAVSLAAIRASQRLDGTVTTERLRAATVEAMASVNAELAVWADAHKGLGRLNLAEVPAELIDVQSIHLQRYQRAVACLAHANLVERYRNYDSSGKGDRDADELEPTADALRRDARWAIRDLLGLSRSTVELI
ncbi:head completion/stabilization protein [Chitinimonas arctica]|uniref:Head completion/stabilization protein n=1 Tax=Chitinimonas arctica TaxID=2594795 RepID=A0A516SLT6_9NEIS|nr:head completion/stabilization protein [Chitinimonas arctica]QDQ27716.1 head completion/stabilization protein [Chitinimonas arctica]QDQ29126.1 head completion/stabilization protein [Chitinimonas arctica]